MEFLKHFIAASLIFVAFDSVWLTLVAAKFYKRHLGHLISKKADLKPAVIFYILYMVGMVVFAIDPALHQHSLNYVMGHGALLGLCMYATYDLTNQSTLKDWPARVTYVDMAWGTLITTVVATLSYLLFS